MITTYAGSDAYGYSGDGALATNALMANPAGIAIDDTGSLYIADNQNNVIRKVDTFGMITTVALEMATLLNPEALVIHRWIQR